MKITIAIPHYRAGGLLKRLLDSLERQNFNKADFEILVVNDELENEIKRDELGSFSFELRIVNKEHGGVAAARNRAINMTSGEFILFLDQDCVARKKWLENIVGRLEKENSKVAAVGGLTKPLLKKGLVNEYFSLTNTLGTPTIDKETGEIITIITANSGFRTEALKSIGGFDEKTFNVSSHGGEDVDLTYRLKKAGYFLVFEPNAIVLHEYPDRFSSIFFKYANYGKGMRLYCLARNIDPHSIRQPRFDFISFLRYLFRIAKKIKKAYKEFRHSKKLLKSVIFSLFELVKFIGHIYGYFYRSYKIKIVKYASRNETIPQTKR